MLLFNNITMEMHVILFQYLLYSTLREKRHFFLNVFGLGLVWANGQLHGRFQGLIVKCRKKPIFPNVKC